MTKTSYDYYGQTPQTAQRWQKHPRATARILKARDTKKISNWKNDPTNPSVPANYKTPTAATVTPSTRAAAAAGPAAVIGALGTTTTGAQTLTEAYTYALVSNPNASFAIVGGNLCVNALALVAATYPISISTTGQKSGKTVTTVINIIIT